MSSILAAAQLFAQAPEVPGGQSTESAVNSAMIWSFLTLLSKAVGKRVVPKSGLMSRFGDKIVDAFTCAFALMIGLSIAQTPLMVFIVQGTASVIEGVAGGAEISAIGWVIGIVFLGVAIWQFIKFAKIDELNESWRNLAIATFCSLLALGYLSDAATALEWFTNTITIRAGDGILGGLIALFDLG